VWASYIPEVTRFHRPENLGLQFRLLSPPESTGIALAALGAFFFGVLSRKKRHFGKLSYLCRSH
jgi:hypothetical protein